MQILEDEHQRTLIGERLEQLAPGRERLAAVVAAKLATSLGADEQAEVALDPVGIVIVGDYCAHGARQLGDRLICRVRLEDARLGFDDLAERPIGDAGGVWQ